jgi:rubrerythrin
MKEFSVREIVEYAIRIEQESFAFYSNASEVLQNLEVVELTRALAADEVDHLNRLRQLLSKKTITPAELAIRLNLDTTLMDRIVETHPIVSTSSSLEVLNMALEREQNTERTYTMFMTFTNIAENIVKLFGDLRNQERGHANRIQSKIRKLN